MRLADELIKWYKLTRRSLPWRENQAPYSVWLSEIILQQTRVDQGLSYYNKFLKTYPTVQDLASASEDAILKLWQGLGYYSRARNLHACAKLVVKEHAGAFPSSYNELIKLPGIGPYTAAAISSICFHESKAVLDGNVYRVLSRLYKIEDEINKPASRKLFQAFADELLDPKQPGNFNQAMMELGAMVCKPQNPTCHSCCIKDHCLAFADGTFHDYPKKKKAKPVKQRYFTYLLIEHDGKIAIQKRGSKDIWEGLYQLPLVESSSESNFDQHRVKQTHDKRTIYQSKKHLHKLSHQTIHAKLSTTDGIPEDIKDEQEIMWVDKEEFINFAQPKLMENLWAEYQSHARNK